MLQQCFFFLLTFNIFTFVFSKLTNENVITTKTYAIWRNATVPFYVNPSHFDHEQTTAILTALSMFAYKTCIKFKPVMARPFPTDEVMVFINPEGTRRCNIDTKGHSAFNPHLVKLGYECLQPPQIDMMIMRALGFPFEHNRVSRDLYIDVLHENIEPGAIELFTKEDTLPLELRFLPYDVNSVMHFSNREYSKNGHRTIIFKDPTVKQNRVGLTDTDIRKIEIVYGPECRARDRQEKLDLCQSYPGVARRKRQIDEDLDIQDQTVKPGVRRKRDIDVEVLVTKSLRVNPDITPPPQNLTDDITKTLKDLGIEDEVQEIVEKVFKVSSLALKNARDKYCNNTNVSPSPTDGIDTKPSRNNSDILGIIEVVADFAKGMVDDAIKNLTKFCEVSEAIEVYQRFRCDNSGSDPRCRGTYRSTKSGAVRYSTQHRPIIQQSTYHRGGEKARVQYGREGDATEAEETNLPTTISVRKKRELVSTTDNPTDQSEVNKTEASGIEFKTDEMKSVNKTDGTKIELPEMEKAVDLEMKKDNLEGKEAEGNETKEIHKKEELERKVKSEDKITEKGENEDVNVKSAEKIKVNNKDPFRMGTETPGLRKDTKYRRSHSHYRAQTDASSEELDNLDKILAKKIIAKKNHLEKNNKKYPKDMDIEKTRNEIKERAKQHHRQKKAKLKKQMAISGTDVDKNEDEISTDKETKVPVKAKKVKRPKYNKKVKDESFEDVKLKDSVNAEEDAVKLDDDAVDEDEGTDDEEKRPAKVKDKQEGVDSGTEAELPRTVTLSKKNEDFYNERRWPDGQLPYMIQEDATYDLSDMRQRLAEVIDILKEKTCVNVTEIKHSEADNYEDYIIIDNSPDYVTGRVGGAQRFGSIELFRGGQHRQHAAMMLMAMLGFYFEVSRHDRDKHIRVHMRHVRPDKLHHFEMIRSDATLPLPYDYASATHPAWQFWRQVGRTGISTVATYKEKDPDGTIMKSLGQNEKLLSDLDIVKINSVYGIDCFTKNALRNRNEPTNSIKVKTEVNHGMNKKAAPAHKVKIMPEKLN